MFPRAAAAAAWATLIPSHVNRCHPAVIKRMNAGGSAGRGNCNHRPLVFISSLIPFNVVANSKISRGRSRKEGRGGRMSKCEGCRLKEPFASPDVRHLLTSKQRRVIKSRLRPEDWQLRSLAPTQHVQRGSGEEKKKACSNFKAISSGPL